MASVFFSYSHPDEAPRDQLEKHFAPLKHEGLIEAWHDRRIIAGEWLDDTISEHLNTADIILALVSSDFLDSGYCYGIEMKRALERRAANECDLVAVILRPCDWLNTPLGKMLATPKEGLPISKWPDRDEAYLDVTMSLRRLLAKRSAPQRKTTQANAIDLSAGAQRSTQPRSSNLRLRREFNDHDRDQFITETFEFVANYFEGSADELKSRNPGVECNVRRIDANRFTATAYHQGKSASACTVFLASDFSRSKDIGYANNADGGTRTWNERLSVENDDQTMFFVASMASRGQHAKMSAEGVAEHLWSMFIEPLQR